MTSLFGCMVNEPERLRCVLHPVRRALVWDGESPPDGWGLGFYQGGEVLLQKRPRPQPEPVDFYALTQNLRTDCVVGHVRSATVGKPGRSENTHPYRFRAWLFAHHGTVDHFAEVLPAMMEHIPDFLRRNIRGQTDSEHLMHLFLAFLHDGAKLDDPNVSGEEAANALGATVTLVDHLVEEAGGAAGTHAILATNGRVLLASRRGRPLSMMKIQGIVDCAACRELEVDFERDSRRVSHEHLRGYTFVDSQGELGPPWELLDDATTVAVSHDLSCQVRPLGAR